MFKSIKKMFTGDKAEQQPQPAPRNDPDKLTFSEAEFKTLKIAHDPLFMQITMSGARNEDGKIHQIEHVTPWVVGYMIGVLDYVTAQLEGRPHARKEVQEFFIDYHFTPELWEKLWDGLAVIYALRDKPADPLHVLYKIFLEGAQAGYGYFPHHQEHGAPKLALYHALNNGGHPPEDKAE